MLIGLENEQELKSTLDEIVEMLYVNIGQLENELQKTDSNSEAIDSVKDDDIEDTVWNTIKTISLYSGGKQLDITIDFSKALNATYENTALVLNQANFTYNLADYSINKSKELMYSPLVYPTFNDYSDIDYENKTIKIDKILYNGSILKHRKIYRIRTLKLPAILLENLPIKKSGRIFEEEVIDDYDILLNTHVKLLLDKNITINIIYKNIALHNINDFETRFGFLLPQKLEDNFEIL